MNVCAVRRQNEKDSSHAMRDLPHEPVLWADGDRDKLHYASPLQLSFAEHIGTPHFKNGNLWCRHCGSLYAEYK